MDLETSLQCDCTVSGVMGFILHLSRIAGLAPLKFERVRGGWRISLSRFYYIYGFLVLIIIETASVFSSFNTVDGLIDGFESSANSGFMRIITKFIEIVQGIAGFTVAYTNYNRFHYTINSIARLEQINKEFDHLCRPIPASETKMWCIVIFVIIYGNVSTFSEYIFYIYDVITINNTVPVKSIAFVAAHVFQVYLHLLPIQFLLVVMRLVSTQERLNNYLKEISNKSLLLTQPIPKYGIINKLRPNISHVISNINHHTSLSGEKCQTENSHGFETLLRNESWMPNINVGTQRNGLKTDPEILVQLANIYCSLCDVLRQLDASNGLPLIGLLLFIITNLVTMPYFMISSLHQVHVKLPTLKALTSLAWNSVCFVMLILVAEPCHRAHDQLYLTKNLITQMMSYSPREHIAVNYELKKFKRHILLNPVSFHPLRLLIFDRYLVVKVVTTIVTYLSVVINL